LYISPVDPSVGTPMYAGSVTSYAANAAVFRGAPHLPNTFRDGTSNTVAFAEHYAVCGRQEQGRFAMFDFVATTYWSGTSDHGMRRATFADGGGDAFMPMLTDVYPLTSGNPPTTRPSVPGQTFQVRPTVADCDPKVPQTAHPGGMIVALADGSVRTIKPTTSDRVFWSAVTPAGGETEPLD
jgi:prepilin-type processing-associated H-X9-DG protein